MKVYKKQFDQALSELDKELKKGEKVFSDSLKGQKEWLNGELKKEKEQRTVFLEELEEDYQTLKNPPVGMDGTEDFLFVDGTPLEVFKKQYKALKFADAARKTEETEANVKKYYDEEIGYCQNIEKQSNKFNAELYAGNCKQSLENYGNATLSLTGEERTTRAMLTFISLICFGAAIVLGKILGTDYLGLGLLIFGIPGCIVLYFAQSKLARKNAVLQREYANAKQVFERKVSAAKNATEKDQKIIAAAKELKEAAKAAEEELREQYKKVIGLVERNKKLAEGKLGFLPKITDEELNMTLAVMDDGEAKTYQEALRIAKDRIEQQRERARKIANDIATKQQAEKYHKEMLAAQKAANDAQLQELERQTEAAKDAAWAAKQSAEANKQQAAAAANAAKSAKNAEKYGKQSAAAMRDIDDRLYRGDAKVEIKKK